MSRRETAGEWVGTTIVGAAMATYLVLSIWLAWVLAVGGTLPFTHHHVQGDLVAAALWVIFGISIGESILWFVGMAVIMLLLALVMAPVAAGSALAGRVRKRASA